MRVYSVDFEMKLAFSEKVRSLNNQGLVKFVKTTKEMCPKAVDDAEDADQIHILVDKIGKEKFLQLQTIVENHLKSDYELKHSLKRQKS